MGRHPFTRHTPLTRKARLPGKAGAVFFPAALLVLFLLPARSVRAETSPGEYRGVLRIARGDLTIRHRWNLDFPSLPECAYPGPAGAPALPVVQVNVALPPGAEVSAVEVANARFQTLPGRFDVAPVTAPARTGGTNPGNPFRKDPVFYGRDADFPGKGIELLGTWDLAGQTFASLRLAPVRYNPVKGMLKVADRLEFAIHYRWDPEAPRQTYNFSGTQRLEYDRLLRSLAFNPEDVRPVPPYQGAPASTALEPGQYEYVLLAPFGYEDAFQPLVDWRTQMGMPAKTVNLLWIYLNYPGASNEEKIRNFVKDAHVQWGSTCFLLGGDTNYLPCAWTSLYGESIPNDTYYADYDGDWVCELYVGRAPIRSTSEIETYVNKVLAYEKNPPPGFGDTVYFTGFDLDGSTHGEETKKSIKSLWVPPDVSFSREYDSEPGGHLQDVIDAMNAGKNLINHIDHCNTYFIGIGSVNHGTGLNTNNAASFTNGTRLSNFYSIGCWPGNYPDNCWGEVFVRDDQGGITFVGNSRSGWYNPGLYNTYSLKYDKKWWKALFDKNAWRAGETLSLSKNLYYPPDDLYKYIFTELNLLGDPGLHLWTKDPVGMSVTFENPIQTGPRTYDVTVQEGSTPLPGARVCLWKGDEVYAFDTTDAAGTVSFDIDPLTPGTMLLTATAQNHLPFEGTVDVQSPQAPVITDIAPGYGLEAGGTPVTVTGAYFTPDTKVKIGGKDCASVTVVDDTTITGLSPAGANGWADVLVENAVGQDVLDDGFRYFPAGGDPFNAMDVHTESVDPPAELNLLLSGYALKSASLFFSYGPGPVLTPYGTMGLDLPVHYLFTVELNTMGYAVVSVLANPGTGSLDVYIHALGENGAGKPAWSWGGNNPNGSGSILIHLNQ